MKSDVSFIESGHEGENITRLEEKTREELISCLSELREKNMACFEKARKEGRERLMVEMTAVRSRIEGLISRINPGHQTHRYRFDSWEKEKIERLHEYDMNMEKMISHCREMMIADANIDRQCTEILKALRVMEKIFKQKMSILRTMQLHG